MLPPDDILIGKDISDIFQGDGNDSITSDVSDNSTINSDSDSMYDTDDEVDSSPNPISPSPIKGQNTAPGQPIKMKVNMKSNNHQSLYIPFCLMMNARSLYNKQEHFKDLYQLGPDLILTSETWEKPRKKLTDLIGTNQYKVLSSHRGGGRVGGGCAIVYNQGSFKVESLDVDVEDGVEAVWALLTPKVSSAVSKVKRIAVGSFYVSPNSQHKPATIDHIIETI